MSIHEKCKDLFIVILDIIAVNASYFLGLIIRYYVNYEYNPLALEVYDKFCRFAPIYTVACILIFYVFKLYGGIWKYAGLNDMNRILAANIVTLAVCVVGTCLMFGGRMPYSYYLIGASLQFVAIMFIRFSHRFYILEKQKVHQRKQGRLPVMIVGSGDIARAVARQLEGSEDFGWIPVVFVGSGVGHLINGIPVIHMDEVQTNIDRYAIDTIIIANPMLSSDELQHLQKIADNKKIQCIDYSGYFANNSGSIPVVPLLKMIKGDVTLIVDGLTREYGRPEDVVLDMRKRYEVLGIKGQNLTITLSSEQEDAGWMKEYKEETGEDVSFF